MTRLRNAAIVAALIAILVACGEVQDFDQGSPTTSEAPVGSDDAADTTPSTTEPDATTSEGSEESGTSDESTTTEPPDDEAPPGGDDEPDPDDDTSNDDGADPTTDEQAGPATLTVEILNTYPHDSSAFTQGLLFIDGVLFESTGLYGDSSRRRVALTSGEVSSTVALDDALFGAGLAVVNDTTLIQLTWREGVAILSDTVTLEEFDRFNYSGEGWGLCHDGERLVMSNGSSALTLRDPMSFTDLGTIDVTRDGSPVERLNELECVGDDVWANVWLTNEIVRIDGSTGEVTGVADLSGLVPAGPLGEEEVLNGIAYDPTTSSFFVTGKNWDVLYEVSFTDS